MMDEPMTMKANIKADLLRDEVMIENSKISGNKRKADISIH